jgi:class 3 adenylate cyclase
MAQLDARNRARLPNSAFAYVDSRGRKRLPIHDEAHVRNALARFQRTSFEDEDAKERARRKLLAAAKKHGIMPIGFVTGQLRALSVENERLNGEIAARVTEVRSLPTGFVTFLLTDIEDSTGLLRRLGDRYAPLLSDVRRILRARVRRSGGREVDARADEFFAVFKRAPAALRAALAIQAAIRERAWPDGVEVRLRIGLHTGRPTLTDSGYVGLAVHTAARVSATADGGQIVLSGAARGAVEASAVEPSDPADIEFRSLGLRQLRGLPEPVELFEAP